MEAQWLSVRRRDAIRRLSGAPPFFQLRRLLRWRGFEQEFGTEMGREEARGMLADRECDGTGKEPWKSKEKPSF
jgi:hypothetical protein